MKIRRLSAGAVTLILALIALGSHSLVSVNAASSVRPSGGKAVVHRAGGVPANAPGAPTSKANFIGMPSGEPTLGVTKNGDIFFSAIHTNTRVEVQRSSDEGATWETVSPKFGGQRNAQLLTLDPYVYVDERTNRVFTVDLTVACSFLSYSDDQGESWITNPLACGRPVNDHMTIFTGPPATSTPVVYPNVLYYCWNDVASSSCSKSLDGGVTFTPTGSPAFAGVEPEGEDSGDFCGGLHGHGQVGPDGTVYIPRGYCGQPWLAFSKDEGTTWTRVQVANNGSADHEASVDIDSKGNIYYSYIGRDRLPYLVISKDGGIKWGRPMMIGPPGLREANLPSLDVGDPGKVAIAYFGSENSPYQKCKPDCADNLYARTTWNGYTTMSANVLDNSPTFYTGTVNDKNDPVKRVRCGPGRCGTTIFDFIDVYIGPDGVPYTSWVDACILACAGKDGAADAGNEGVLGRLVGGPRLK